MQRISCTHLIALVALTACGGKPKPEAPAPVTDYTPYSTPARPASDGRDRNPAATTEETRKAAVLAEAIYFGYDQAALSAAARSTLDAKAAILKTSPQLRLVINGHTDERGSDEYNLALGMRRASAARRHLQQAGVSASRIEVVSYGEERPAMQSHDEQAFAANRRDEFVVAGAQMSQH